MASDENGEEILPVSGPGGEAPGPPGPVPEVEGYEVLGPLGEGGMGTVWRAVQLSTHREVALKLLGSGAFGSDKARLRFEREVEVAARLEHPHIARVYDSGLRRGVYYYAMELVEGLPLDDYVEQNHLDRRQTLELMRMVCQAVQHAHQRGVIHRDLKPWNIFVTPDGQPHVLDFGLAKDLFEWDAAVPVSVDGEVAGTPAYMSPEQAAGKGGEIDTRTDVYSLGVILYRLLTGDFPHSLEGTRYAVLKRIAEEEVRSPRAVAKDIDKELEALLLKALAHDPDGRYASAGDVADDITNYLTGEPLMARPPTTGYFLRKRIRKYRGRVAVAALVLAALAGMAVWSYVRVNQERADALSARDDARREADKATAVTQFFQGMLYSIDPSQARGREVTVREIFDKAAKQVGEEFRDQPLVEAAIRSTLGTTYNGLGDWAAAYLHGSVAVEIRTRLLGPEHPETLWSMRTVTASLYHQAKYAEAEQMARRVVRGYERSVGKEHEDTLAAMNDVAISLQGQEKDAEAEHLLRQIVEAQQRALGKEHMHTLQCMGNLAEALARDNRHAEAEKLNREVLEIKSRVLGKDHPSTLHSMRQLAGDLLELNRRTEAEELLGQALGIQQRVLGKEHPDTLTTMAKWSRLLADRGKLAEAEALGGQVLAACQRVLGKGNPQTLESAENLAQLLSRQRRHGEAEDLLRQVLEIQERTLGKEHPDTLVSVGRLGCTLADKGEYAEAAALQRQALEGFQRIRGREHSRTLRAMYNLGVALQGQGRHAEAAELYRQVLEVRQRLLGKEHRDTLLAMTGLGKALHGQHKYAEAAQLHGQVVEIRQRVLGKEDPETLASMRYVMAALHSQGRYAQAETLGREVLELRQRVLGKEHADTLISMQNLAAALEALGKADEAAALRAERELIVSRLHAAEGAPRPAEKAATPAAGEKPKP